MSDTSHMHTDNIIVDADEHFTIDPFTREINCTTNKKLTLMQFDKKSERYSFDINRIIDGHDLMDCDRVQIHFINIGSSRDKHPGLYLVDDVQVMSTDDKKITFTWLVSEDATSLAGVLSFLVSFECTKDGEVLYRWSSNKSETIKIVAGMDNNNAIKELYADELLEWQNRMQTEVIPDLINKCYVERDFATKEEVAQVFDISNPDGTVETVIVPFEEITEYVDNTVSEKLDDIISYIDTNIEMVLAQISEANYATKDEVVNSGFVTNADVETAIGKVSDLLGNTDDLEV